jgi:hypothetical protein
VDSGFSPLQLSVGILQGPSIFPLSYVGIHARLCECLGSQAFARLRGWRGICLGPHNPCWTRSAPRELALAGKGIATKQIVRRAIFLDENDYMLNQPAECYGFADSIPQTRGMCIKSKQR